MSHSAILAPVFVQVALTFGLLVWLGVLRVPLITGRKIRMKDIALDDEAWPVRARQASNAFANQLELPVLFYVLAALAIATGRVTPWLVALAWLFVALRIAHAAIHVTHNRVPVRFFTYVAGLGALLVMWLVFIGDVLLRSVP